MSKTAQRKASAYQQGFKDGVSNRGFRWKTHPCMGGYSRGFAHGTLQRQQSEREVHKITKSNNRWLYGALGAMVVTIIACVALGA